MVIENVAEEYTLVSHLAKELDDEEDKGAYGWAGIFPKEHNCIFLLPRQICYIGNSLNHSYSLILCSLFSVCSTRNIVILTMQESLANSLMISFEMPVTVKMCSTWKIQVFHIS